MTERSILTGKQAKRIVRHIENHIKKYVKDSQIELTDRDLEDYLERLKKVVQTTNSSEMQRKAAWVYELVEKIQFIR